MSVLQTKAAEKLVCRLKLFYRSPYSHGHNVFCEATGYVTLPQQFTRIQILYFSKSNNSAIQNYSIASNAGLTPNYFSSDFTVTDKFPMSE